MTRTAVVLLALTMALDLTACAAGGAAGAASSPRRNPNRITAEELAEASVNSLTLYDAIQRLRPTWLRSRGVTSISGGGGSTLPSVLINDAPQSIDALRGIRASDARELEFLSGADATTLYGTGHVNGMIKVRMGL